MTDSPSPLTPERLRELQELCDAATPGPWRGGRRCDGSICATVLNERVSIGEMYCLKDAGFCAAARTALPEVIAAYTAATARIGELESLLRKAAEALEPFGNAKPVAVTVSPFDHANYALHTSGPQLAMSDLDRARSVHIEIRSALEEG
jgi:hypothetical protein